MTWLDYTLINIIRTNISSPPCRTHTFKGVKAILREVKWTCSELNVPKSLEYLHTTHVAPF